MTSARQRRRKQTRAALPRTIGANDNAPGIANDNVPCLIMLGDLPLVSRHPIDALSPGELSRVLRIEAALRGRNRREASRLALDYEASQGITTEERIAAMRPANDIDRMVEEALGYVVQRYSETYEAPPPPKREKRLKGKRKPKAKTSDPVANFPVGDLRQDEIDAVTVAEAKLKSLDLGLRSQGAATMARIRKAVAGRVSKSEVEAGLAERSALEALRGSEVEPGAKEGPLALSRDGLETLSALRRRKDGYPIPPLLSRIQHAAGLRYRRDYEMADPEKKLTPPDPERISSHGGGGEGWAEKQMEIQRRIWRIHLMIAGIEVREGSRSAMPALPERHPARRAIHVLNEVAGKGTNLWNLSQSGSVRFRNAEALKTALDCAAIVYELE